MRTDYLREYFSKPENSRLVDEHTELAFLNRLGTPEETTADLIVAEVLFRLRVHPRRIRLYGLGELMEQEDRSLAKVCKKVTGKSIYRLGKFVEKRRPSESLEAQIQKLSAPDKENILRTDVYPVALDTGAYSGIED